MHLLGCSAKLTTVITCTQGPILTLDQTQFRVKIIIKKSCGQWIKYLLGGFIWKYICIIVINYVAFYFMHTSLVLYSTIFALSMERTWLTFHCWLYNLCIVVYVTNKTWNLKLKGLKSRIGDLVQPMYLHTSCALCLHWHDTSSACSITLLQTEREWKALLLYRRDFGEGFAGSVGSYVFKASLLLLASPKSPMNRFGPSLCMCVQYTQCPILKS